VCHPAAGSALVLVTGQVRLNTAGMLLASDHFDVVVTDCGDGTWEWEIYCGGKPLPARMRDGPFKSHDVALQNGQIALQEFLEVAVFQQESDLDGE
jgi:hypothetical protein